MYKNTNLTGMHTKQTPFLRRPSGLTRLALWGPRLCSTCPSEARAFSDGRAWHVESLSSAQPPVSAGMRVCFHPTALARSLLLPVRQARNAVPPPFPCLIFFTPRVSPPPPSTRREPHNNSSFPVQEHRRARYANLIICLYFSCPSCRRLIRAFPSFPSCSCPAMYASVQGFEHPWDHMHDHDDHDDHGGGHGDEEEEEDEE